MSGDGIGPRFVDEDGRVRQGFSRARWPVFVKPKVFWGGGGTGDWEQAGLSKTTSVSEVDARRIVGTEEKGSAGGRWR
jgi:hypothetical protein